MIASHKKATIQPQSALWSVLLAFWILFIGIMSGVGIIGPTIRLKQPIEIDDTENFSISDEIDVFIKNNNFHGISIDSSLTTFPQEYLSHPVFIDRIETISIKKSYISNLPTEIENLKKLISLRIYDNRLTTLPPSIGNLKHLKILGVTGNLLTQIPVEIGNLSSLQTLILGNNALSSIPPTIGNLTQLTILDLHKNNLHALPTEIKNLKGLKVLFLGGNPLLPSEKKRIQVELPDTLIYF